MGPSCGLASGRTQSGESGESCVPAAARPGASGLGCGWRVGLSRGNRASRASPGCRRHLHHHGRALGRVSLRATPPGSRPTRAMGRPSPDRPGCRPATQVSLRATPPGSRPTRAMGRPSPDRPGCRPATQASRRATPPGLSTDSGDGSTQPGSPGLSAGDSGESAGDSAGLSTDSGDGSTQPGSPGLSVGDSGESNGDSAGRVGRLGETSTPITSSAVSSAAFVAQRAGWRRRGLADRCRAGGEGDAAERCRGRRWSPRRSSSFG